MSSLSGRHVFVTGSTHGVGLAIAGGLRAAGAAVVGHGLCDDASAEHARAELGQTTHFVFGDLAGEMPDCVTEIADAALAADSAIDTLVCNAGTYSEPDFLETDYDSFDHTMKLNVSSQYVLVQYFARRWVEQGTAGRILLIGSINGRLSEPTHVAYDTSKGAVEAMIRSLCVSLAPRGIRVNGMAPGLFETPLTAAALRDPRLRRWMELHTPNGRVPGPEVCAETAAFLLSDAAEHIHGQMLLVDGGMSIWQQPDPPDSWMPAE